MCVALRVCASASAASDCPVFLSWVVRRNGLLMRRMLSRGNAATYPEKQEWPFAGFSCVSCCVMLLVVRLRVLLVRSCCSLDLGAAHDRRNPSIRSLPLRTVALLHAGCCLGLPPPQMLGCVAAMDAIACWLRGNTATYPENQEWLVAAFSCELLSCLLTLATWCVLHGWWNGA